ncbi:MAG: hypothetical protein ABSH38_04165 [Verrucomicrobiota bacterium]|jgi:uncharacterized membrane protein
MNTVTAAHIHLLLCHAPIMAILFAFVLLIIGLWRGNSEDQKIALATIVAAAVLTLPLYLTGKPASGAVKGLPGFVDTILERHQTVAALALAGCSLLGVIALAGLLLFRDRTPARWFGITMLFATVIVGLILIWTANLGGQIRHSEIRAPTPTDAR